MVNVIIRQWRILLLNYLFLTQLWSFWIVQKPFIFSDRTHFPLQMKIQPASSQRLWHILFFFYIILFHFIFCIFFSYFPMCQNVPGVFSNAFVNKFDFISFYSDCFVLVLGKNLIFFRFRPRLFKPNLDKSLIAITKSSPHCSYTCWQLIMCKLIVWHEADIEQVLNSIQISFFHDLIM